MFNDILIESLSGRFLDASEQDAARETLASVPDYLEPSIRWPVYPEIAAQQGMRIDCRAGVTAQGLPANVSLNLYRVLQEALHNAAKHSGVHECDVRLWAADGSIHLTVTDRGAGFDVDTARARGGIGLLSMQERIRLVDGMLSIDSRAGHGTTIHASVPYRE